VVQQENRGLAGARNAAIERARGRYLSMFDSDDLWMPNHLAVMERVLRDEPRAAYAHSDAWVLDESTRRIRRTTAMHYTNPPNPPPTDPSELLSVLLERNFVSANATLRRSVLDDVGFFNATLRSAEDYELWLRMAARGYWGLPVRELLVIRRVRADSLSADTVGMVTALREVYRLVTEDYEVPPEIREKARVALVQRERQLAELTAPGRLRHGRRRIRRKLGKVRDRLLWRRLWFETPPPEVRRVYPDLRAV
jgi:glycosyltransferase involved in cell wall biosynthesis